MLSESAKRIINIILVSIVVLGMIFSYSFSGRSVAPAPVDTGFTGPSSAPAVNGPTGAPTQKGPSSPPPGQ